MCFLYGETPWNCTYAVHMHKKSLTIINYHVIMLTSNRLTYLGVVIITIKDIARAAGVSTATVSYVLNGTRQVSPVRRQRVLDVINETGYQPNVVAKNLRTQKTNTIGVLVEDVMSFSTPGIINGISEYMEKTEYHILLNDLRMMDSLYNQYDQVIHQKEKIHKELMFLIYGAKVDAVIYIGMFDRDISGVISDVKIPVVIAYSISKDPRVNFVTYENENISAQVAGYLINKGHKRIAVITGLSHTAPAQLRLEGFRQGFVNHGCVLDETLMVNGNWERDSGYSCMKVLLKKTQPPTAVFVMNDLMAIGAIDAIHEAGLTVPQDIAVVSFDNREFSYLVNPKLSTVEIDLRSIGYTAAQMVAEKLSETGELANKRKVIIPSKLLVRESG